MAAFSPFARRLVFPCLLIVLTVLFFVGGPGYHSPRHLKMLWNIGHIIYFALLPRYLFSLSGRMPQTFAGQLVAVFAMALLLGGAIEVIQAGSHRLSESGDLFRNCIGGMVALFFLLPSRNVIPVKGRRCLQIFTLFLVGTQFYLVFISFLDEYRVQKQFPVLSDFESELEKSRWQGTADVSIVDKIATSGKRSLRVAFGTDTYSGVKLFYFSRNWEGYKLFQFKIYNPDPEEISITCRIHDKEHVRGSQTFTDRFNRRFTVASGWHTIRIDMEDIRRAPEGREMDLTHIWAVGIFASRLPHPRVIYLDDVKLIP